MHMMIKPEKFTHKTLLLIMPFGTGYMCQEDGEPWPESVMTAIALTSLQYVLTPNADMYQKPLEN